MKPLIQLPCLLVAAGALLLGGNKVYAVGATVPWTEYEAEAGTLAGGATVVSLVQPLGNSVNGEPVNESSGAAYVSLAGTGQSVSWVNNSGQSITALNLRIQIPDAPGGHEALPTRLTYTLMALCARRSLSIPRRVMSITGSTMIKIPRTAAPRACGMSTIFSSRERRLPTAARSCSKKDSANSASFYNIDLVDLEAPPAALTQPANSLSITSYGAVVNSPSTDNTTAIQNCVNAAQSQGKSVWIPAGIFYMGKSSTSGLNVPSGVVINGAGIWYSTLYSNPSNPSSGGQMIGGVGCTLKNFAMDCNSICAGCASATGMSGSNWRVDSVWFSHTSLAVWGGGDHGVVANTRVNNTWSDGENMNNFSGSSTTGQFLTETNNFLRFTGDAARGQWHGLQRPHADEQHLHRQQHHCSNRGPDCGLRRQPGHHLE